MSGKRRDREKRKREGLERERERVSKRDRSEEGRWWGGQRVFMDFVQEDTVNVGLFRYAENRVRVARMYSCLSNI